MLKILVIDDEKPTLSMFRLFLTAYGYQVVVAENGKAGLELFDKERPQIVFTDIKMPEMDGIEVLKRIRSLNGCSETAENPHPQVIVITGHGDMDKAIEALDLDASDFINKPVEKRALESALKRAELRIKKGSEKALNSTSDATATADIDSISYQASNNNLKNSPDHGSDIFQKSSDNTLNVDIAGRLTASSYGVQQMSIARETGLFKDICLLAIQFSPDFSISRDGIDWMINFMAWVRDQGINITMNGLSYNYIRFFQMAGLHEIAQILESQSDE